MAVSICKTCADVRVEFSNLRERGEGKGRVEGGREGGCGSVAGWLYTVMASEVFALGYYRSDNLMSAR